MAPGQRGLTSAESCPLPGGSAAPSQPPGVAVHLSFCVLAPAFVRRPHGRTTREQGGVHPCARTRRRVQAVLLSTSRCYHRDSHTGCSEDAKPCLTNSKICFLFRVLSEVGHMVLGGLKEVL